MNNKLLLLIKLIKIQIFKNPMKPNLFNYKNNYFKNKKMLNIGRIGLKIWFK